MSAPLFLQPQLHNGHRLKDVLPAGAVWIDRRGPWGNPFHVDVHGSRDEVIEKYRKFAIDKKIDFRPLRGKDLICWCHPKPCHGDVVLAMANGLYVLVTGGRDYADRAKVDEKLSALHEKTPIAVIIHGDASGADTLARDWALKRKIADWPFPANWQALDVPGAIVRLNRYSQRYNLNAGFDRNQVMADLKPDLCIAFPGGRGTADMVSRVKDTIEVRTVTK